MRLSKPFRAIDKIERGIILWQNFGDWTERGNRRICPIVKIYNCTVARVGWQVHGSLHSSLQILCRTFGRDRIYVDAGRRFEAGRGVDAGQ